MSGNRLWITTDITTQTQSLASYLALEEPEHPTLRQEPLAVDRSLVRHVPHGGPGRLHHVITVPLLQLLGDDVEHLLHGPEAAHQHLLLAVHLTGEAVEQKYSRSLIEAVVAAVLRHDVKQDFHLERGRWIKELIKQ